MTTMTQPMTRNQMIEGVMAHQRRQAIRMWEPRPVVRTLVHHPRYVARRRQNGRELFRNALGMLLVLGALVLMAAA